MPEKLYTLLVLVVIVFLSLIVAAVLFNVLTSTGVIESRGAKFGGAAAGFFATLILLHRWYVSMEGLLERNRRLQATLVGIGLPKFEVPTSFVSFVDHEHSMLFCYPNQWRRQPLKLQVQGFFSEDPLSLRAGDDFPGQFSVVVSSPGQQTYSLKEVAMISKPFGVSVERIKQELGIELSAKTESLGVPLERVLHLLGAEGQDRKAQIYDFNFHLLDALTNGPVRRDKVVVDNRESLLLERNVERENAEAVVQFLVITFVPETDLIFTFTFTDNAGDRSQIDLVRQKVMATVKFWKPLAPSESIPGVA